MTPTRFHRDERGMLQDLAMAALGLLVLITIILVIAFVTGLHKTPKDKIGLSYGGGPLEGAHYQRTVEPGHGVFFNGIADKLYLYPVTQRNYIISKTPEEGDRRGRDFIQAPSRDSIPVDFEVATYFKLNLAKLGPYKGPQTGFHETIGLKYAAWTDDGWEQMLHESFRVQIESAIQQEARQYLAVTIYSDREVLLQIQNEVGSALKERINAVLGDEYFCGPTYNAANPDTCPDFSFVVKKVDVPPGIKDALQRNRQSEIDVLTKKNEVLQKQQEARAIEQLNKALRSGTSSVYVDLQYLDVLRAAIAAGKIEFWVLPSDGKFNFTAPVGRTAKSR